MGGGGGREKKELNTMEKHFFIVNGNCIAF